MGISLQPAHSRLFPISYRKDICYQKLLYLFKNSYISPKMSGIASQQCLSSYNGFILCFHKAFSQNKLTVIEVNQATQ